MSESKSDALPLGYEALKSGGGLWIWTTEPEGTDLQSAAFDHFANPPKVVPTEGIEPPTYWLQVSCATNYAKSANGGRYRTRTYDPLLVRQVL